MHSGKYPILYKYRSASGDYARDALERVFQRNQLHWENPANFNDPFDCAPCFIAGRNARERKRYFRDLLTRPEAGLTKRQRQVTAQRLRSITPDRITEIGQGAMSRFAVTCFSTKMESLLMWAHYADEHRGVCLRFEQQPNLRDVFIAFGVDYSDERPIADISRMREPGHTFLNQCVLTKAKCWEYESEYRMIENNCERGFRVFPKQALTGVIFGARMPNDRRNELLQLIEQSRPDVEVLQAELNSKHYGLSISVIREKGARSSA